MKAGGPLQLHPDVPLGMILWETYRKVERQVKVLLKHLAIFFLCPSKQFLPISFQIQLLEYYSKFVCLLCHLSPLFLPYLPYRF